MSDYSSPGNRNYKSFTERWTDPNVQELLRAGLKGRTRHEYGYLKWSLLCGDHKSGRKLIVNVGKRITPGTAFGFQSLRDDHVAPAFESVGAARYLPTTDAMPQMRADRPASRDEREAINAAAAAGNLDPIMDETYRIECEVCGQHYLYTIDRLLDTVLEAIARPRIARGGLLLT